MKKPSLGLFLLRLFFYMSAAVLILVHPGITVSYDRSGLIQWFLIIPLEALIAFLPAPKGKLRNKFIIAAVVLCILSGLAGGRSLNVVPPFFAGAAAFFLTFFLFYYPRWGKLSALEPFFLTWICFQLLSFSRSGEDAAWASSGLTQFIFIWTLVVFLFHSAVVYFCLYPQSTRGASEETTFSVLIAAAALALAVFILPADFIRNAVVANLHPDQVDKMTKPADNDYGIIEEGGRQNRQTIPRDRNGGQTLLRSLSEHDWPSEGGGGRDRGEGGSGGRRNDGEGNKGRGRGSGGNRRSDKDGRGGEGEPPQHYTVMVVASQHDPVYMGNIIQDRLDPVEGFLVNPEEILNRLPSQRFFVTWFDNERVNDRGRQRRQVFSLSTLSHKYLPYRPSAIEPTVLSENSGPLRYIHQVVSRIHIDDPLRLLQVPVRELSQNEKANLASYLELPLEKADLETFQTHLDHVYESWSKIRENIMEEKSNEYIEKIMSILWGFSEFQYEVNDINVSSIEDMLNFITTTKEGDCVLFSSTAALLGRLAGIPSRVVVGYIASQDLQTIAHKRGIAVLRSGIPVLQEFPFENLFLVTDDHKHSWPQFYIPDYGWIDFEATQFAIPPVSFGGDVVVIPGLDNTSGVISAVRAFPWRAVMRTLTAVSILALLGAYVVRYGREAALAMGVRRGGRQGARSLYLLLLARMAADGKPIKPVSKTAPEYAELFPGHGTGLDQGHGPFAVFADLYTELRWRDFNDKGEEALRFALLKNEYQKILAVNRRKGLRGFIARIFSLRGLAYL